MSNDAVLTRKGWKVHYDIIRLMAILLVIFNHTAAFAFPYHSAETGVPELCMLLASTLVKVAVPLFFMISGAMLLARQESIRDVMVKRVLRFLGVILLFHLVQSIYCVYSGLVQSFSVKNLILNSYLGGIRSLDRTEGWVVWFLYAYLAFLLLLPILRVMVAHMTKWHFYYLFILHAICFALLPSLSIIICRSQEEAYYLQYLTLCGNVFVFIIAGYYIENRVNLNEVSRKHMWILGVGAALSIITACFIPEIVRIRYDATYINQLLPPGAIPFMLVPAIAFTLVVKKACSRITLPAGIIKCLPSLGRAVLTVMLVENILRLEIRQHLPDYQTSYLSSVWLALLVWLSGILLGLVLKRIPYLNKIV